MGYPVATIHQSNPSKQKTNERQRGKKEAKGKKSRSISYQFS